MYDPTRADRGATDHDRTPFCLVDSTAGRTMSGPGALEIERSSRPMMEPSSPVAESFACS